MTDTINKHKWTHVSPRAQQQKKRKAFPKLSKLTYYGEEDNFGIESSQHYSELLINTDFQKQQTYFSGPHILSDKENSRQQTKHHTQSTNSTVILSSPSTKHANANKHFSYCEIAGGNKPKPAKKKKKKNKKRRESVSFAVESPSQLQPKKRYRKTPRRTKFQNIDSFMREDCDDDENVAKDMGCDMMKANMESLSEMAQRCDNMSILIAQHREHMDTSHSEQNKLQQQLEQQLTQQKQLFNILQNQSNLKKDVNKMSDALTSTLSLSQQMSGTNQLTLENNKRDNESNGNEMKNIILGISKLNINETKKETISNVADVSANIAFDTVEQNADNLKMLSDVSTVLENERTKGFGQTLTMMHDSFGLKMSQLNINFNNQTCELIDKTSQMIESLKKLSQKKLQDRTKVLTENFSEKLKELQQQLRNIDNVRITNQQNFKIFVKDVLYALMEIKKDADQQLRLIAKIFE